MCVLLTLKLSVDKSSSSYDLKNDIFFDFFFRSSSISIESLFKSPETDS